MSSDAPTLSTDVIQDGTGAADVAPDGATAGVSPATDVLSGIGSPVNLPARTVILPGEADSPPTLAEAPTAPFVTGPQGVATAQFVTAPPGSATASFQEFASMLASVMQQANAAGSRAAPQPPQPYTLDSNIVAPGTVSMQQARPPAGFAFAKETAQRSVADWLAQVEHFCVSMRVAHPVALAGNYLEGGALLWYLQWKGDSDPHELVWSSFRRAILSSNLVDPAGFQTLIDQHRSLSQGQRNILDYVRYATTLRQKAFSHRFLAHYPEFFFVEAFHACLSKDLQSRMPEVNEWTTLAAYTLIAIRIGRPLERPGWKPPAPSGGGSRWPRRSGASATVAALSPPPEAATDEAKLAAWERSNLNGQDRRDARIKRGACTFCGVSGHKATHCPVKPARVNALAYDDDVATLHVDTENGVGAAQ